MKYLNNLIIKKNLCGGIVEKINQYKLPVINTYFASAIAIDKSPYKIKNNFLMICDTDINRVWVPDNPGQSKIKYFVPSEPARKRLLAYGVKEENILFTGFPLPKENLGTKKLEILKQDLFNRLLRLDPQRTFFSIYKDQFQALLNKKSIPQQASNQFTVLFSIGGAGAQYDMAKRILATLKEKIKQKKIQFILALGVQKHNYKDLLKDPHQARVQRGEELPFAVALEFSAQPVKHRFEQGHHPAPVELLVRSAATVLAGSRE